MSFALKNACSVLCHFVPMGLKTCQNVPNTYISFAFVKTHVSSNFVPFRVISCQRLLRGHENVPKRATRGFTRYHWILIFFEAFLAQHVCFPVLINQFLPMAPASAEAKVSKLMALKGKLKGKGKDVKGAIADILKGKGFGNGGALGKGVGGKTQEEVVETPKEVVEPPKPVEPPKDEEVKEVKEVKEVVEEKKVVEETKESRFDFIYTMYIDIYIYIYATCVFDVWACWF